MAFTTENTATADGSTTNFSFTFPYLEEKDIRVTVEAAAAGSDPVAKTNPEHWTLANATTISFGTAPANDSIVRIFRDTNLDDAFVTYFAGSAIRAEDLNENQLQVLYSAQEVEDNAILLTGGTMTGNLQFNDADIIFEGENTTDGITTTLTAANPTTSSKTITLPNTTGTVVTTGDSNTVTGTMIADNTVGADNLSHTGVEAGQYTTADITVDEQGRITAASNGTITAPEIIDGSVTSAKIEDGTIQNVDINADAEIAVSKLADGDARQLLQTAADGTTVAWTDDVDIPGTLDVTSTATFDQNATVGGNLTVNGNTTLGNDSSADTITTTARIAGDLVPSTDGNRDLGTTSLEWRNLHLDGTANIDSLNADTADINGGNIDNAVIGGTTPAAGTFTNLTANGSVTLGDATDDLITFTGEVNTNIVPSSNGDRDLGTSAKKWNDVHSEKFTGPLTGNVTGKADTADQLHSAVNIAGVSFDGSEDITIGLNNLSDVNVGTPGENQDEQVLTWNWDTNSNSGSFGLAAGGSGGSGLSSVVADNSPQLGGDLDVNGNKIVTDSDNDNVVIAAHGTGGLQVGDSANNSIITTSGDQNLNLDPGGTGDIVLDGVFTINDEGFTYNNTLESPEEVFGLDIETNGDPKLKVSTSGTSETGEFQVFFGDPNAGSNARGVRLWAGDTSNKHGRVTIEGRVDSTETVFDVNTSANDSTSLSNKITFDASGKALFQELDINGTATFDGNVTIEDGASLILQNSAETTHTISINADDVSDSYNLTLPPAHGTAGQVLRIDSVDNDDNVELEWGTIDVSTAPRLEHSNTTDGFTIAADSNAAMVGPLTVNQNESILIGPGGNGSNANSVFKIL